MTDAEIDALSDRVDALVEKINREIVKAEHTYTFSHDDGVDGEIDASASSLDATDDDENSDHADDDNELPDDDEDEEDDGNTNLGKASINEVLRTHSPADRPGALKTSTHTQPRHKFEALVDKIKNDQGIPRSQAMAMARMQFPDVYASYQDHTNGNGNGSTFKRAPATYEQMVEAEMRKGCNREIAGQRIAQLHGFRAFDQPSRITKRRDGLLYTFQKRVDQIMYQDGVDAAEATRRARMEDPRLFSAMQRTG
jgi:hypothetical protein